MEAPPTFKEGRKCKRCKCTLSIYNQNTYCHICRRTLIDEGTIKGRRFRKDDRVVAVAEE